MFADSVQKKVRQMTYREHYHHGKGEAQMIREQAHSGIVLLQTSDQRLGAHRSF